MMKNPRNKRDREEKQGKDEKIKRMRKVLSEKEKRGSKKYSFWNGRIEYFT